MRKVKAAYSYAWNNLQEYTANNTYNNNGFHRTLFRIRLDKCIARLARLSSVSPFSRAHIKTHAYGSLGCTKNC